MSSIYGLSFRRDNVGGPVVMPDRLFNESGTDLPGIAPEALRAFDRLTFLIHGFNVNRADGRAELTRLAREMANRECGTGCLVPILWPGDSWLSPVSYPVEESDARDTARNLARFYADTLRRTDGFNIVAHSLGCLVALETMRLLANEQIHANQVVLFAGAVESDVLGRSDRYAVAVRAAKRVVTVASPCDDVLKWGFRTGHFFATIFSGAEAGGALGYKGPERGPHSEPLPTTVLSIALPSGYEVGHGDYLPPAVDDLKPQQKSAAQLAAESVRADPWVEFPEPRGTK